MYYSDNYATIKEYMTCQLMLKQKPVFGFAKCYLATLGIFSYFASTIKWILFLYLRVKSCKLLSTLKGNGGF